MKRSTAILAATATGVVTAFGVAAATEATAPAVSRAIAKSVDENVTKEVVFGDSQSIDATDGRGHSVGSFIVTAQQDNWTVTNTAIEVPTGEAGFRVTFRGKGDTSVVGHFADKSGQPLGKVDADGVRIASATELSTPGYAVAIVDGRCVSSEFGYIHVEKSGALSIAPPVAQSQLKQTPAQDSLC